MPAFGMNFIRCPVDKTQFDYGAERGGEYKCPKCGFSFPCSLDCEGTGKDRCDDCAKKMHQDAQEYVDMLIKEYGECIVNPSNNGRKIELERRLKQVIENRGKKNVKVSISNNDVLMLEKLIAV